ncbi:putative uncharacterized protein [Prevotella sp. CAG:924]|nr:putative uncharacterized protein [Prevotella sp. CAG:924]
MFAENSHTLMFTTTEFIIRIALAGVLGAAVGLERELRAKEAGTRTHFLVSMGSALFTILSQYGFDESLKVYSSLASFDPSRIAAQVVTGIGFIGAGTIIFQKHVVKGLTTAAGLWVTAAIGMTVATGLYALAIGSTILVLCCLEVFNYVMRRFGIKKIAVTFSTRSHDTIRQLLGELQADGIDFDNYEMKQNVVDGERQYEVTLELKLHRRNYRSRILSFVKEFNGVSIEVIE